MTETLKQFFSNMSTTIKDIGMIDIIDILCLAVFLYFIAKFIVERRAGKLALGVVLLLVFALICEFVGMHAMQFLLKNIFQLGFLMLVILFQPELRSALEKVGNEPIRGLRSFGEQRSNVQIMTTVDQVCSAVADLSQTKTGALIVFERFTKLGDRILTGTVINAEPNSFLIKNIFFNKAPLHDGAMIIRDNRLYAAGCLLPLSENLDIIQDLGTRHRAAIGLSENSDAVVVVVSEETGTVSLAYEGKLERGFTEITLKKRLVGFLDPGSEKAHKKFVRVEKKSRTTTNTAKENEQS